MEFLSFLLLVPAVISTCILAVGATSICWALVRIGWLRRTWQFMVLCPLIMVPLPAWWIRMDQIRTAACIAENGPGELMCTGEIGGLFLDMLRWGSLVGGLVAGPFLGRFLAHRWIKQEI